MSSRMSAVSAAQPPAVPVSAAISVAVVGSGIIGHHHADAVLRHPRLRVGAVVDPDPAAARKLAEHVDDRTAGRVTPPRYPTLAAALADCGGDVDEGDG